MISTHRCTGSAISPATQGPSTWCSTAIFCRRLEPRRRHDADRAVAVLLPVPRAGNPCEADAATQRHVGQMLAVLVEVPERWLAREAKFSDRVEVLSAQQQSLAPGESVSLASTPVAARWHHPRSLRSVQSGRPLGARPGRRSRSDHYDRGRCADAHPTAKASGLRPETGSKLRATASSLVGSSLWQFPSQPLSSLCRRATGHY